MIGKVTRFDGRWGFIKSSDDVSFFFHASGVIGEVRYGDEVDYWLDDDPHHEGLRAVEVRRRESGTKRNLSSLLGERLREEASWAG